MSKVLETIKEDMKRARNLSYYGKYMESIQLFGNILAKVDS